MIDKEMAQQVLHRACSCGADFSELFCENRHEMKTELQKSIVFDAMSTHICGIGIRVMSGLKSAYAYTNDLSKESLMKMADQLAAALQTKISSELNLPMLQKKLFFRINEVKEYPSIVAQARKTQLLKNMETLAYSCSDKITNISLELSEVEQYITIYNSEGLYAEDERILSDLRVNITAANGKVQRVIRNGTSFPNGFEVFESTQIPQEFIRETVRQIVVMLHAQEAPSSFMPVIIEGGDAGGTLIHEACGHSLELDGSAGGKSELYGKLGQIVASKKVTLIADGTLTGFCGSSYIDDEGVKRTRNVLIEKGVLKSYMLDRMGARRLGLSSTGNGRRQNYTYPPLARMTNTFLLPGDDDDDEMITTLKQGLFVKAIGGGSVNAITGAFNLNVLEGYLIKDGKIGPAVANMSLSGKGSEVLMNIERVGKKQVYGKGSFCGANSGLVPVTAFQPRVRVSGMIVGGMGESK